MTRVLSAWSINGSAAIAVTTALWGVRADLTSPRIAIAAAGVPLLATPALLPRRGSQTSVPDTAVERLTTAR